MTLGGELHWSAALVALGGMLLWMLHLDAEMLWVHWLHCNGC